MTEISNDHIRVRGARVHNLRNVSVDVPRDSLVVLTGVSGSGKSSLAFDTLFAEGQRRYLESLSTYTRQYLDQLERPDADLIDGLPPTVSIDQRTGSVQPRSTLAITTEIYDYLRVLYARAGQAHCTKCGRPVSRQSAQAIVDQILGMENRRKVMILAPLVRGRKGTHRAVFEKIVREGFVRARVDGEIIEANDPPRLPRQRNHDVEAVVDRIVVKAGIRPRLLESVERALKLGDGTCVLCYEHNGSWHDRLLSEKFACPDCGISFPELQPRTFSFNSPYGACEQCDGLGVQTNSQARDGTQQEDFVLSGEPCRSCQGSRLNAVGRRVTVGQLTIQELTALTVADALHTITGWLRELKSRADSAASLSPEGRLVAERTLPEIESRLLFLAKVGLDYLSLERPTRTLSGGEFQRARLAGALGSGLIGVCYVLDEPTIGLHARDTGRLVDTLQELRDAGNSVLVVEHDPTTIARADCLIDLGPGAGDDGGRLIAIGTPDDIVRNNESITGQYLRRRRSLFASRERRLAKSAEGLRIKGARLHNLDNLSVDVPLGVFTCITGVSGSGKSSLIAQTLVPALENVLSGRTARMDLQELHGTERLERVVEVDQSPIGRSGRSNPATYAGIWDEVRKAFAKTREARIRGYTARRFSFNARQGRCETCLGQGTKRIEMHFMPDMHVTCPRCKGARFNRQTLSVRYAGKNVADVLAMRIDEAAQFFHRFPKLRRILSTFHQVGLGYLCLGQSSLTLSGGEAQRVKLATELSRSSSQGIETLFVLDEPTTGLHLADVAKLISLLHQLVDEGHSVLIIEHELDVVAAADWVIDLGPEGGTGGGKLVAQGTPEEVADVPGSHTGRALAGYLGRA